MSSNVTPEIQQLKQQQRNALRQEYWKKITQPPSSSANPGDVVFDPGHQRYFSMASTKAHYFKPTYWHGFLLLVGFILPLGGLCYFFKTDRDAKELKYRTGQVAYKDRYFKLI